MDRDRGRRARCRSARPSPAAAHGEGIVGSIAPEDQPTTLSPRELEAEHLDDWRYVAGKLRTRFRTGSFADGLDLLVEIGAEAERANHHPDVDLRYAHLDIALRSHDVGAITTRDVRLARAISAIAARRGLAADIATWQGRDA